MRSLLNIWLLAATILMPVRARDSLPPAMQSAIDRLLKGAPTQPIAPLMVHGAAVAIGPCAVPLLEVPIDHADRFALRSVPGRGTNDPMPRALGAPRCDPTAPSK